jgi:hypothetical protein
MIVLGNGVEKDQQLLVDACEIRDDFRCKKYPF